MLPVLVGSMFVYMVFGLAIGFDDLGSLLFLRPTHSVILVSTMISASLLLFGIVIYTMRDIILRFFSGDSRLIRRTGIAALLTARQRRRYIKRRRQTVPQNNWRYLLEDLKDRFDRVQNPALASPPANDDTVRELHSAVARAVSRAIRERGVRPREYEELSARLILLCSQYSSGSLRRISQELTDIAEIMEWREIFPVSSAKAELQDEFGPPGLFKPTRLGNTFLALDYYPYIRYKLDGGLFWPHLENLADEHVRAEIAEKRVQLDMVLAHSVIFLALGLSIIVVGPWIEPGNLSWALAGSSSLVLSRAFYTSGVHVAASLARSSRALCDLFRHELLKKLGFAVPPNLAEERRLWDQLSRLVAFGAGGGEDQITFSAP